jgi:MoxR-like ATPase
MSNSTEKTCWDTYDQCINAGIDRLILFGPPGTGKTYTALNSHKQNGPSHRLTCTDDMTNMDVTGGFLPSKDGFEYIEGAAIKARRSGGRLVVDEIDKAGGDVFATLLNMTDSAESAEWEHPVTGEKTYPQPGYTVIMTTNVEQIEELPEALTDRFPVQIRIDRPHPHALRSLPSSWQNYADRMADAGSQRMSLRLFQSMHKLSNTMGEEDAAKLILGPRADAFLEAIRIDNFTANKS